MKKKKKEEEEDEGEKKHPSINYVICNLYRWRASQISHFPFFSRLSLSLVLEFLISLRLGEVSSGPNTVYERRIEFEQSSERSGTLLQQWKPISRRSVSRANSLPWKRAYREYGIS